MFSSLKLCSNGVRAISCLGTGPRHLVYSTSSSSIEPHSIHFVVDFLVSSLGFSREEALATSKKVINRLESPENPNSVINLFSGIGFKQSHVKSIVYWFPSTLALSDPDKTLIPKLKPFQELGLSGSELGDVIAANPSILSRSVDSHILPLIEFLRSVTGSSENVVKALKRSKILLTCSVRNRMLPNVKLLESYGISGERLGKLVTTSPRNLLYPPEFLKETLKAVEEKWGISRQSRMFLHGLDSLASISQENVEMKVGVFKSYGWTDPDIGSMVRNLPYCIKLSDAKIRTGLDFYMGKLKYEPKYIASQPKLLMFNLEKRVLPRIMIFKALREKKLVKRNPCLYTAVGLSEKKFLDKFLIPHRKELAELYDAYLNSRSAVDSSSSLMVAR